MYDLIVVGLGIYGSAVAAEATTRGLRVLAVDQFAPPHTKGSSHGGSRLLRLTTVEAEEYVPLAKRALQLWRGYNNPNIITETGFAIITQKSATKQTHHGVDYIVDRACAIARKNSIPHVSLRGVGLMERFPGLHILPDDQVFYEPSACVIKPEVAIEMFLKRAKSSGATLLTGVEAKGLKVEAGKVTVAIGDQTFMAKRAVVCTGSWQHKNLLGLSQNPIKAKILPQVVMRIPSQPLTKAQQFPGFVYMATRQPLTYVVPPSSGLPEIKWGVEQSQVAISEPKPNLLPIGFLENSARLIRARAKLLVPTSNFKNAETTLCYYTATPDSKHIVRKFDAEGKILLVSACSGHGFKYAPAIAENIVRAIMGDRPSADPLIFNPLDEII